VSFNLCSFCSLTVHEGWHLSRVPSRVLDLQITWGFFFFTNRKGISLLQPYFHKIRHLHNNFSMKVPKILSLIWYKNVRWQFAYYYRQPITYCNIFLSSPVTEKLGSKFLESKNSILKSFLHQETSKPKSLRSSQLQNTKKSPKNWHSTKSKKPKWTPIYFFR
jgi:hypothetical protein